MANQWQWVRYRADLDDGPGAAVHVFIAYRTWSGNLATWQRWTRAQDAAQALQRGRAYVGAWHRRAARVLDGRAVMGR